MEELGQASHIKSIMLFWRVEYMTAYESSFLNQDDLQNFFHKPHRQAPETERE